MRRYWLVNLTCVILSAGFLFGIVLALKDWSATEVDYEAESRLIIGVDDQKIERSKDHDNDDDLSIIRSLDLSPPITSSTRQPPPSLPSKYLLDVPFTSQAPEKNWDQPWQDACEEAAVLMLDAYYKKYDLSPLFAKDEILKIIDSEEKLGWGESIEIGRVEKLVEDYIFGTQNTINKTQRKVKIVENPMIEDIKRFIVNGQPVLIVADGKALPNPHFRNGGPVYHALIIRGYTETEFITNDPGTQFGRGFRYKYDDLLNAIHDWNGGDVKNGEKVILVVE